MDPFAGDGEGGLAPKFQFIDLSATSTEQKKRNRTIARSHAMKVIRGAQRRRKEPVAPRSRQVIEPSMPEEEEIETVWSESTGQTDLVQDVASATFDATIEKSLNTSSLCPINRLMLEHDIAPLRTYLGKPTPALYACIDHITKEVLPLFWPASSGTELSPLVPDWFSMTCTSPALFHASLAFASTYIDARQSSQLTNTPEVLGHNVEAIRQINSELSQNNWSDSILLAIMSLAKGPEETELERLQRFELNSTSPFTVLPLPPQWHEKFVHIALEDAHFAGARTIIDLRGGFHTITSPCTAKTMSLVDLREAAWNLRKPYYPFYDIPAVCQLAHDPSLNVLTIPIEESRGRGFIGLLSLGLTRDALTVILDMVKLGAVLEGFCQNTLMNPNLMGLICRRTEIHHRLLSLPTGPALESSMGTSFKLYECCRLAALAFATAALFEVPISSGVPRRLVLEIKAAMEDVSWDGLYGCGGKFYIWVLFLGGVWAERMPERSWYVKRLRGLLELESVSRWSEVKRVVMSFLWLNSVCDAGGMRLWDEAADGLRTPSP